jgi:hypothetical protein
VGHIKQAKCAPGPGRLGPSVSSVSSGGDVGKVYTGKAYIRSVYLMHALIQCPIILRCDSIAVGFSFRAALTAESGSVNPVRN